MHGAARPRISLVPLVIAIAALSFAALWQTLSRWLDETSRHESDLQRLRYLRAIQKFDVLQALELLTYDWRVRRTAARAGGVDSRLGLVRLDEHTITIFRRGELTGMPVDLLFPREVYGRVLRELNTQGAL